MQTLPTPVSPTKVLTMADVANQNGAAQLNKPSIDNAKASFQAELNRQVRAKQNQAPTKQDKSAEPTKSQAQSTATVKDESAVDKAAATTSDELNNVQGSDSFLNDLNQQLDAARDLSTKVMADDANTLTRTDIANASEANAPAIADLISALGIPAAQNASLQGLQANADHLPTSSALASGAPLPTEAITSQKGLAFNANTANQADTTQEDAAVNDDASKIQSKALTNGYAEEGQSKAKSNTEESAFNKALVNIAAKDTLAKNVLTGNAQVQTAPVNVTAAQSNNLAAQQLASSNMINVYPGKSGWDQAISQKVVWMVGAGQQSATLTLNPPDLGPLKVVINVHNDQADTTFISDNDEVRKALESGMSHLRDKMTESGIQLGQANVSTSQQSQQEFQQATQNKVLQNVRSEPNKDLVDSHVPSKVTVRVSDGLVDTFA